MSRSQALRSLAPPSSGRGSLAVFEKIGEIEGAADRVLIRHGERYFRVPLPVWSAVAEMQRGEPRICISGRLTISHPARPTSNGEHPALEVADRLIATAEERSGSSVTVRGRIDLDVSHLIAPLSRLAAPIARSPVAFLGLVAALLVTHCAVFLILPPSLERFTVGDSLLIAGAMFAIMALHEIGHAAAATAMGCRSHRIGLGLLLLLPVFYADVSEIWRLRPSRRIAVNAAGIFVQLLMGLVLFAAMDRGFVHGGILNILFYTNFLSVAVNLLPFGKLDGYWMLADWLEIPDLQARSWRWVKNVAINGRVTASAERGSVMLYATLSVAFIVWLVLRLSLWSWSLGLALFEEHRQPSAQMDSPFSWLLLSYAALRVGRGIGALGRSALKRRRVV